MSRVIKAKTTSIGLVELVDLGTEYAIYVSGVLKLSTSDLMFALREFDRY